MTLLIVGMSVNAQFSPSNNLNYIKLLKNPPIGTKADSVMVFNGTDKFVKMIPTSSITTDISGKENISNKQNSLAADGTGVKYPTVDAINKEFFLPAIAGDNQPQIQSRIDALFALGGGVVRLGTGNYTINSSIRLKDGVSIKGVAPKFNFGSNCPDLNFIPAGGTRIVAMSTGMIGLVANEISSTGVNSGIKALSNVFIEELALKGFEIAIKVGAKNQLGFGMGGLNRVFIDGTGDNNTTVVTKKAIELYNAQQMSNDMVLMYKVRNGLIIANEMDTPTCSSGNSVWTKTYVYLDPSGTSEKSTVISAITAEDSTTITTTTANELEVNDLVQLVGVTGTDGEIINRVHTVSEVISATEFKVQTNTTGKTFIATGICEKGRAGIHLKAAGNEPLNHVTFYSPQVNVFLDAYQNKAIVNIALTGTLSSRIGAIGLYHTDTEGLTDHHLYLDGVANITHNTGTVIDAPPLGHIAVYNANGVSFESNDTDTWLKLGDTRITDGNNAIKYNGSYKGYIAFSKFPSLGITNDVINSKSYIAGNTTFQALEVNSINFTVGSSNNSGDAWMPLRLMSKRAKTKISNSISIGIDRAGYLEATNNSAIIITLPKIGSGNLEAPVGVPITVNKVSGSGKINIVGFTGQTVGGISIGSGGYELPNFIGSSVTLMSSGFTDWVIIGENNKTAINLKANIDSPTFTGVPSVPTATAGTNTTQIASTAFVNNAKEVLEYANEDALPITGVIGKIYITLDNNILFRWNGTFYDNLKVYAPDLQEVTNSGAETTSSIAVAGVDFGSNNTLFSTSPFLSRVNNHLVFKSSTLNNYRFELSSDYITENRVYEMPNLNGTLALISDVNKNRLLTYTVATLPASPTQGDSYAVTDALAPAYLVTVVGGGTVYAPVVWNGTNWVSH